MNWLPRLKIYRSPLPDLYFTPRQRGILVHLCLEHLIVPADIPPDERQEALQEHVLRAVRQGMRLFPLPLDDPERIAAEMAGALSWFASLPEAPLWLARGMREQGIMDEHGRMHRVDLLVDKGDGSMHAVDYKTGQAKDEHHAQVQRYMRLAAQATGRPVRGFLVYLDERRLLEVRPEGQGSAP
jgi:ATP-dependent exoDNAse (exonuclease V) beta subunit